MFGANTCYIPRHGVTDSLVNSKNTTQDINFTLYINVQDFLLICTSLIHMLDFSKNFRQHIVNVISFFPCFVVYLIKTLLNKSNIFLCFLCLVNHLFESFLDTIDVTLHANVVIMAVRVTPESKVPRLQRGFVRMVGTLTF